jgi:hypothetical protein
VTRSITLTVNLDQQDLRTIEVLSAAGQDYLADLNLSNVKALSDEQLRAALKDYISQGIELEYDTIQDEASGDVRAYVA